MQQHQAECGGNVPEVEQTLEQEGRRLMQLCASYGADALPEHVHAEAQKWIMKKLLHERGK